MDEHDLHDFSEIGRQIKEGIQNTVNQAVKSMDFSKLNESISGTVQSALKNVSDALDGNKNNSDSGRKQEKTAESGEKTYRAARGPRARVKQTQLLDAVTNKVTSMLCQIFGALGMVGFGVPFLVGLVMLIAGRRLAFYPLFSLLFFLPLTIGCGWLFHKGSESVKKRRRMKQYLNLIGEKKICAVRNLSKALGVTDELVRKEIQEMINDGVLMEGHLDEEGSCIYLDDETWAMYLKNQVQMKKKQDEEASRQKILREGGEDALLLRNTMDAAQKYLNQIREVNADLPEAEITEKMDRLETLITKIYLEVEKNPKKLPEIRQFTEYYLPTTIKLVKAYREFDQNPIQTENMIHSKKEIRETLDTINHAFEKLLDGMYDDVSMDISTDIAVLQTLLAQEGLTEDGMHMG